MGRLLLALLSSLLLFAPSVAHAAGWQTDYETARRIAGESQRLVVVHFWAPWCAPCMRMEREVFSQPTLAASVERDFVLVKLNRDNHEALARQFGVNAIPADVIVTPKGQVVARLEGFRPADRYAGQLQQIATRVREVDERNAQLAQGHSTNAPHSSAGANTDTEAQPAAPPAPRYRTAGNPSPPSQPVRPGRESPQEPPRTAQGRPSPQTPPAGARPPYRQQPRTEWSDEATLAAEGDRRGGAMPEVCYVDEKSEATPDGAARASADARSPARRPAPVTVKLPPGCPPLGLEGYCPVELVQAQTWSRGDVRHGAIHRGRTYLFASQEHQQAFLADPDRYAPALSGDDPVQVVDAGRAVTGSREYGGFYEGRLYLFSSEDTLARFDAAPERYAAAVVELERR